MVLFVFVIMLLNAGEEVRTNLSRLARWVGLPLGVFFLAEMGYLLFHEYAGRAAGAANAPVVASTTDLSMKLFTEFVLPFELTSILILIAVLGAMVLARKEDRKSTRLNSSHPSISYAVFCLKKKKK